jgi:hypothetical protein
VAVGATVPRRTLAESIATAAPDSWRRWRECFDFSREHGYLLVEQQELALRPFIWIIWVRHQASLLLFKRSLLVNPALSAKLSADPKGLLVWVWMASHEPPFYC